jgi:hypothetical protein
MKGSGVRSGQGHKMSRYPEPGTTKSSEVGKFRRGSEISRFDRREGWDKELEGFGMEVV